MSSRHRPGSGRRYEEFLDGSYTDDSALSALLDAARAPGTREDMAGLPAARTAFMSVPYVRTRPAASVSRLPAATRTAAGRLLALKFVAAVSGATLVGGAAYAATGAKLLGGSQSPHKHSTSSSAPAVPGHRGGSRQYPAGGGGAQPTPGGQQPQAAPAATTHDNGQRNGSLTGRSSAAHEEHNPPATPPGQSNTPGSPQTSHSPSPHHTPTPHDTKPHPTPNPHKSSPGHGDTNLPKTSAADGAKP
jgi:hypothetical protein